MNLLKIVLLICCAIPSIAAAQPSTSAVMQVSVHVVEGLTATVRSGTVVLPAVSLPGGHRNLRDEGEQLFGSIGLQHPPSAEYILSYQEELKLVNHRGEQIRYSATLTKDHKPGSSRCDLTLKGKKRGNSRSTGSFYGTMTVTIEYL